MSSWSQFLVLKVYSLTISCMSILNFDHIHPHEPDLSHLSPTSLFFPSLPPTLISLFNDSAIQLLSVLQQQSEVSFLYYRVLWNPQGNGPRLTLPGHILHLLVSNPTCLLLPSECASVFSSHRLELTSWDHSPLQSLRDYPGQQMRTSCQRSLL